ncbi:MAG: hypothetical protein ACO2PN_12995 [Pyrobaculum sp.]|jgi:hypothetical protein
MATKKAVTVAWGVEYTGRLVLPVAFKCISRRYVEYVRPVEKTVSRNLMNGVRACALGGVFTYAEADVILLLEQTSLMRQRYVVIYFCNTYRDLCRQLAELAEAVWKATGSPKLVVAKILETYGKSSLRPTTMSHPSETP